jgi:hypothetical protein
VGYYGDCGDEVIDENTRSGDGYLAEVCEAWERSADLAAALGLRVVMLRTGIALGAEGGALKRMLLPFRLGVGGPMGDGKHWMPWIHAGDLARLFLFAAENESLRGPVNGCAPNPVRNKDFAYALAHVLRRPALLSTPRFAMRMLFGEMAQVLFDSARAIPAAALKSGFAFEYPELAPALRDLVCQ